MGISDSIGGLFGKGGLNIDNVSAMLDQFGGMEGIMSKLQSSGLGDQLSSWIGKGENATVSPDQIKDALGKANLDQLAGKVGLDADEVADRIATKLPDAMDKLTPDGVVPDGGFNLESLTKMFG
jgi:uncharacterized protein YidB (DUF937 family)